MDGQRCSGFESEFGGNSTNASLETLGGPFVHHVQELSFEDNDVFESHTITDQSGADQNGSKHRKEQGLLNVDDFLVMDAKPLCDSVPSVFPPGNIDDDNDSTTIPPVICNPKGLAFDTDRITNDWFRERLLRNRASAERSRQRKKTEIKSMEEMTVQLEGECAGLKEENQTLRRQLEVLQVIIAIISASKSRSYRPALFHGSFQFPTA
jgi:hypothetical protein